MSSGRADRSSRRTIAGFDPDHDLPRATSHRSDRRRRFGARRARAGFVASLTIAAMMGGAAASPASASMMLGAHVDTPPGMTQVQAIKRFENRIGHRLPALRMFYQWDSTFPNSDALWAKHTNHRLFISFKAKTESSGGYIKWRNIAHARRGSRIYQNIVRWANGIKRFRAHVLFSFQPEPEAWSGNPNGGPAGFRAAWRRVWQIFHRKHVRNITYVWTMTDWAFSATDQRAAVNWWPGGKYVDAIGADTYNWWTCRGRQEGWQSLASRIEPLRRFGLKHPTKGIYLPEFGSVEDRNAPGRKAHWFEDIESNLKAPKYRQFKGILYFDEKSTDDGICDWRVDTSASSLRAFSHLAGDSFYRSR
jgi:Glycosyl hydrolase family 26